MEIGNEQLIMALLVIIMILVVFMAHYTWQMIRKVPTVLLFYATWCGYCKSFRPEWESLKKDMAGSVKFMECDIDNDAGLKKFANYYTPGVDGVPKIWIIHTDGTFEEYTGERRAESLAAVLRYST